MVILFLLLYSSINSIFRNIKGDSIHRGIINKPHWHITLINDALLEYIQQRREPLEATLLRVLREELERIGK
ncbi:hypothetical protein [Anabaena catenula]|uniref:hypothetical protein n=1 Tax=Anabaena catenula TaxID=1296320 RepID=UPI001F552A2E|nr:hypothetical protein [Anabaena catenula]